VDPAEVTLAAQSPHDLVVDFVAVAGEKAGGFVTGSPVDILLQLETVAVPVDIQMGCLGGEPVEGMGDEAGPFAGEHRPEPHPVDLWLAGGRHRPGCPRPGRLSRHPAGRAPVWWPA
jgi:hypothetical protein